MPPSAKLTWQSGALFPFMDQNLPEGDLFMRIRQLFPKQPPTLMHLLALTAMRDTLQQAPGDERIPKTLLNDLSAVWEEWLMHGR
jgi:hypothetical protein